MEAYQLQWALQATPSIVGQARAQSQGTAATSTQRQHKLCPIASCCAWARQPGLPPTAPEQEDPILDSEQKVYY